MFNESDKKQIAESEHTLEQISEQLSLFKTGFNHVHLTAPCTIESGIRKFAEDELKQLCSYFEGNSPEISITKFVPASGAASRMFKHIYCLFNNKLDDNDAKQFIEKINSFPFYEMLSRSISSTGNNIEELIKEERFDIIAHHLLDEQFLNFSFLPKALIPFHTENNMPVTSLEEHFYEAIIYAVGKDNIINLHFTVSSEHLQIVKKKCEEIISCFSSNKNHKINIDFSVQQAATDTIAVDLNNVPYRTETGNLLFRPAGHGALLDNLNQIHSDIIFIKNIDNVQPQKNRTNSAFYKKVAAGYLLQLKNKTHQYLHEINSKTVSSQLFAELVAFSKKELNVFIPEKFALEPNAESLDYLYNKLNRPIRVCGMVKNEGEPGGGPFWVKNSKGELSCQIVESSQVNFTDNSQKQIFESSTHFNPVDIVFSPFDYLGNKFDLHKYKDNLSGLITIKTHNGNMIKVMELPGLWNGAMYDWISVFVVVPPLTFSPVKSVNDLLRSAHQEK
jgi:hypothetical protein